LPSRNGRFDDEALLTIIRRYNRREAGRAQTSRRELSTLIRKAVKELNLVGEEEVGEGLSR